MVSIRDELAEQLYAKGWRNEIAPLREARAVLHTEHDVYATLKVGMSATPRIYWFVWSALTGKPVGSGSSRDAIDAAEQAVTWINTEWK